jgi:hypothetical protein
MTEPRLARTRNGHGGCASFGSLLMVFTAPILIAPFIARRIHAVDATVGGLDGASPAA